MSTQTIETLSQRVIELISDQHDVAANQITLESQFVADLAFDSLDRVEFMMEIEEEFDIAVPDELIENIITVRNAVETIQRLISA
ncbi:MAG: acyl carrier protein [Planctomycetota bacterium]|jgi:acyl carrier protein